MAIFKKSTTAKAGKKPAAVKKTATVAKKTAAAPKVSAEERHKMIEREAYFIAEKQGFQGDPHAHWLAATKKIDAKLAKK